MVSIVITTKNAEEFIADCIKSVVNSNYIKEGGKVEIILVDNHSTDKTVEIAKFFGVKTFIKGPERSAQRNYGVEMAFGEIVGILDVDMTLSETVISECVEIFENNENIKAVYVPEKIFGEGFFNKVRNFERSFYNATVIDGARFFRRESFLQIGGFDISLNGTEDWDIDASNFDNYFKKWGFDEITKKQFGFYYRYFGVFIEKGKWKKLFAHPALTISMYFLLFLRGCVFILSKFNISKKESVYK